MPIYMDRHDLPGVTAKDVAAAHQADLQIQDRFGCKALTYWFDKERGIAFCLVEAPAKESVKRMHDHAHGLIPHQIIEVDQHLVESFLGRIENPEEVTNEANQDQSALNESALRTILAIDLKDTIKIQFSLGKTRSADLIRGYYFHTRDQIRQHEGRETEFMGSSLLASFTSGRKAIRCAAGIQKKFSAVPVWQDGIHPQVSIGISAGMPVTRDYHFFEQAILHARRYSFLAGNGQILVSSEIMDLIKKEEMPEIYKSNGLHILIPDDEKFLNQIMEIIERNGFDSSFKVMDFCQEIGFSKSQLYRKITSLTGYAPNEFIKEYRIIKAAELLGKRKRDIAGIAFETGFTSPSYFSKCFQKRFGMTPSDFILAFK